MMIYHNLPLQITFRHMAPSDAVSSRIRAEAVKLNRYYDRITGCHVVVEAPHRHHKRGCPFHIRVELGVPREKLVIQQAPCLHRGLADNDGRKWSKHFEAGVLHKDVYVSIRDTFNAARRRLQDYARRLRGDVKNHARRHSGRRVSVRCVG